jgi:hypothetical protein
MNETNIADKIISAALKSKYYVTPEGVLFHIDFVDADLVYFQACNKQTNERIDVYFEDLVEPEFYGLVQLKN